MSILTPFKVIKYYKKSAYAWVLVNVILANMIILVTNTTGLPQMITQLCIVGYFLTYSISIMFTHLGTLLNEFLTNSSNDSKTEFIGLKIVTLLISFMLIIISLISLSKLVWLDQNITLSTIIIELVLFALSLLISFYMFCISLMSDPNISETFKELEDKRVSELISSSKTETDDGEGARL